MSRPKRPPRAWIGPVRPVDPNELLGPRGLTQELLDSPDEDESEDEPDASWEPCTSTSTSTTATATATTTTTATATANDRFYRSLLTDERLARIESVINARLSSVTVVLDRLLDPHNVAAILRSAEGMGIGTACVVAHEEDDAGNKRAHRRVTRDADKWLEVSHAPDGAAAARGLIARGFAVYAGHLGETSLLLQDVPVDRPVALLFGNEHEGPSAATIAACTGSFRIPMAGFTQSFNVSVAAAIALYGVAQRRRALLERPGDLDEAEQALLRSRFWKLAAKLARRLR